MECKGIEERLSAYIDKELSPEEQLIVAQHLKDCSNCSLVLNELEQTVAGTEGLEEVEPPGWLEQKVMAKVREEAAKEQGFLNRLFDPLRTYIPVQVIATLAVVITAFLVFRYIEPEVAKVPVATTEEMESRDDALMQRKGETDAAREIVQEHSEQEKTGRIGKQMYKENQATVPAGKEERDGSMAAPSISRSPEPWKAVEEKVIAAPEKETGPEMARRKSSVGLAAPKLSEDNALLLKKKVKVTPKAPRIKFLLFYPGDQDETAKQGYSDHSETVPGAMSEPVRDIAVKPGASLRGYITPRLNRDQDGERYVYSVTIDVVDSLYHVPDSMSQDVRHELEKEKDRFIRTLHAWKHVFTDEEVRKLRQDKKISIRMAEPLNMLRSFSTDDISVTVKWNEGWE